MGLVLVGIGIGLGIGSWQQLAPPTEIAMQVVFATWVVTALAGIALGRLWNRSQWQAQWQVQAQEQLQAQLQEMEQRQAQQQQVTVYVGEEAGRGVPLAGPGRAVVARTLDNAARTGDAVLHQVVGRELVKQQPGPRLDCVGAVEDEVDTAVAGVDGQDEVLVVGKGCYCEQFRRHGDVVVGNDGGHLDHLPSGSVEVGEPVPGGQSGEGLVSVVEAIALDSQRVQVREGQFVQLQDAAVTDESDDH